MDNIKVEKYSTQFAPIDLVVLSYNGLETTKDFIVYLYKNTLPEDFHLIFLDNGSTDGTTDFLKEMKLTNMSLLLSTKNLGVIGGRNACYDFAKNRKERGKFLMFLDNDQFVRPDWLRHHRTFLEVGNYDLVGVEAWKMDRYFMPIMRIVDLGQSFTYVGCGGMLMKNEVPDTIGMFDTIFNPSYFEDPDFNFRCIKMGYKIGWNAKAKLTHMPHQTLGKIDNAERTRRFSNSLIAFRQKWKGTEISEMRQADIFSIIEIA